MESKAQPERTELFLKRWFILSIFCGLSMSNAFQWIEYAIISNIVSEFYHVPYIAVDWTSMIYMLAYIPLILPATWILDKYGLRLSALFGAFGNCLGAWIKVASARPNLFGVTFLGQTIVGASQIFTLGLPPRLAAVWFGPREVGTATAIGVFGNQLGIAAGFLIPPMMVPSINRTDTDTDITVQEENTAAGLLHLFILSAVLNSLVFLLVFFFFNDAPPKPPSPAQLAAIASTMESNYLRSLKQLFTNVNYLLLLLTYGMNVGAFYAISTLLNQMVLKYFPGHEVDIGRIGLLIVVAGMFGSIICGIILDRTHHYKWTTLIVYALSCVGMVVFTFTLDVRKMWIEYVVSFCLGFFMTGYLSIGFEFGAELTYPVSEGTVSGMLNAAAQIFGLLETSIMGIVIENASILVCNITLCVILLVGTVLTLFIRADLRRKRATMAHYVKPQDSGRYGLDADADLPESSSRMPMLAHAGTQFDEDSSRSRREQVKLFVSDGVTTKPLNGDF